MTSEVVQGASEAERGHLIFKKKVLNMNTSYELFNDLFILTSMTSEVI